MVEAEIGRIIFEEVTKSCLKRANTIPTFAHKTEFQIFRFLKSPTSSDYSQVFIVNQVFDWAENY